MRRNHTTSTTTIQSYQMTSFLVLFLLLSFPRLILARSTMKMTSSSPKAPPSRWHRLLLRQGRWGHNAVTVLIVFEEMKRRYFKDIDLLLLVAPPTENPANKYYDDDSGSDGIGSTTTHEKYIGLTRTAKHNRKGRDALRLEDEAHVQTLSNLNVSLAKYAHVSPAFIVRHNLQNNPMNDNSASDGSVLEDISHSASEVLKGLSSNAMETKKKSSRIGLSNSTNNSYTKKRTRKNQTMQTDKDGNSISTNSVKVFSTKSKLFGAYPADAPPIQECGNAKGLVQYARRYGYGHWLREDDVDAHTNSSILPRRRNKRRMNIPMESLSNQGEKID